MKRFLLSLRTTFVSGLLAILPVGATVYIVWFLYQLIDGLVGKNTAFGMTSERVLGQWVPGLGIVTASRCVKGVICQSSRFQFFHAR